MIIVIDGPSGTGKSTVAKEVAKRLGFVFFDTGAMYRCFAWKVLQEKIDPSDEVQVSSLVNLFDFTVQDVDGEKRYFVGEEDVTKNIRSREISSVSSQISMYSQVRKAIVKKQRQFARKVNAVFEGRDMGTVVFPSADLKIFLTADPVIRAERRYQELIGKFPDFSEGLTKEEILQEVLKRDQNDTTRSISPLKQAPDAILIDTSELSIFDVVDKILQLQAQVKPISFRMKTSYWLVYLLARFFFKVFFRLKIHGLKHLRPGAGILIANHTSFYDPPVLSISCPEEVHFMARESLFCIPLLGRLIHVLNTHPVSQDAGDMAVLKKMVELLQNQKKIIVFPEGKRSIDGNIQPFQRGFGFLAIKAKCPVYPAYLHGVFEAWPPSRKLPRFFGKITCAFGSPIEWNEFEDLPRKEAEQLLIEKSLQSIENLKKWYQGGSVGDPP